MANTLWPCYSKLRHPNILLLMGICQRADLSICVVTERVQNATLYHRLHHTVGTLITPFSVCNFSMFAPIIYLDNIFFNLFIHQIQQLFG